MRFARPFKSNLQSSNGHNGASPARSVHDAEARDRFFSNPDRSKIALVLAGGGMTGAVYEIGALRAIDDMLVGVSVNDFDIYVGTSAGALISSLIANGFTPREIMQMLDNRHPELSGFRVGDLFRANFEDVLSRLVSLPRTLFNISRDTITHLGDLAISDIVWELAQLLPNGIYNSGALERYLRYILEGSGRTNRFDQLKKELFIVATELDSGARAVFSNRTNSEVPISLAVAASSAVPVLYRPVQIFEKDYLDGGLHGAASLDLAIEAGAKLVVCINPMVPINATVTRPNEHYVRNNGLQAIINQTVRTLLHSSLRYHIKNLQVKHPDVDIILIQPPWDDYRMFNVSPMHYSGRLTVAEHGFESVTTGLMSNLDYYRSALSRHDVGLRTELVRAELTALQVSNNDTDVMQQVIGEAGPSTTLNTALSLLEGNIRRLADVMRREPEKQRNEQA